MFAALTFGIPQRAVDKNLLALKHWQLREFTTDKHHTVDDRPYGGGPGMVMKVEPLIAAINHVRNSHHGKAKVVYLSPQGEPFSSHKAKESVDIEHLILVAGRYEGIDERIIETAIDEEWSIGDYVLSGGEIAAMAVIDSIARLIPGVLGHEDSAAEDSFAEGLLDYPHYTRPEEIAGLQVPDMLLKGDHFAIHQWRLKQSLGRTWLRRPDLLAKRQLTPAEQKLLAEFIEEVEAKRGTDNEEINSSN